MNQLALVGVPGDRRTDAMADAARAVGLDAVVVPWTEVLAGRVAPSTWRSAAAIRIDTVGEDPASRRALLLAGGASPADVDDHHRVAGSAAWYRGLVGTVTELAAAAGPTPVWPTPRAVALLCDKEATSDRLAAAGIPVPGALPGPHRSWADVRRALAEAGWRRAFLKPRHGSAAAGAVALVVGRDRVEAWSPTELDGHGAEARYRTSLRVRRFRGDGAVGALVDHLAADGLVVERWFPKLGLAGGPVDLRVVVTDGRPGHVVGRSGRGPFTNLHLGGGRADLADVRRRLAPGTWERALDAAVDAAAVLEDEVLHAGVDVLLSADGTRVAVAEVNAFGDLLPGVLDQRGRSTHQAQADLLRRRFGSPSAVGAA